MHPRSMENRLRLAAQREGLRLEKSRARDPHDLTFGGYMLVNIERNEIAYGVAGHTRRGYTFGLEDVEAYLKKRDSAHSEQTGIAQTWPTAITILRLRRSKTRSLMPFL